MKTTRIIALVATLWLAKGLSLQAQGTAEDYRRANALSQKFSANKVLYSNVTPRWIGDSHTFWYVRNTAKGPVYMWVDADKQVKKELLDHSQLEEKKKIAPRGKQRHWMETDDEKEAAPVSSPDGKYTAYIKNHNIYVKKQATGEEKQLSHDGTLGNYYSAYIRWSPDSRKVASCKIRPVEKRYVYYVESSPADQLQPQLHKQEYAKPGDELPFRLPCIYEVETGKGIIPPTDLFDRPYALTRLEWNADSRAVTFEYNQRGHQVYRILELSAESGKVRSLVEETSDTYVNYSRYFRHDMKDGKRMIWMSERDNWAHLYLYDRTTATPIRQITKGEWYVREVLRVDEANQQLYFSANGMQPGEDPYLIRYYRIGLDGKHLVCLTPEEGMHQAWFSADMNYLVDVYSMVDKAPVAVLREARSGKVVMPLETADISALEAEGWKAPEVFKAKGRDGKTDMWGMIIRPTHFDPAKKYPVLEYIYQGPGNQYVPKTFIPYHYYMTAMAELGFIVVMVDGMGTSFRSRAFENVCYRNLKDAGLPDHIAWIKAAATRYPYMDTERVGIYGCSAGGQEAMAAVLFHPEFYKAAYAACGCHDNRMDKIWWNEQWLGYPVADQYKENSNVENAHLLKRPLMLVVGELDDNVDPASTMQVANALIKAHKEFELVVIPGARHTMGESYGEHKRYDFFVRHLLNANPPGWDEINVAPERTFTVQQPDRVQSPYTGMTRRHWMQAGEYLLKGAFGYIHTLNDPMYFPKQLDKTYPTTEAQIPIAKLEGLARTLFIAAPLLKENPQLTINGISVADYYRHQLIKISCPDSQTYIPHRQGGASQTLLELGSLTISMKAAQAVLWDPLTKAQKDSLAATMLSYGEGPTIDSNWMFFNVFILSFFKDQGYAVNETYLESNLKKLLERYRGQGWYNDAPAYDYYSAWAYQTYGPIWAEMYGKKQYPQVAEQFLQNQREMVESYPRLFSRDGKMNMWGRSICYRFAAAAPLSLIEYGGNEEVNYGWMRRIASSTLLQFLQNPEFLQEGIPTMGFYGPFAPAVQIYSCRGSVYWCGKAFLSLLLPESARFWSAKENNGPWERDWKEGSVCHQFLPGTNLLITNYPHCGGSEVRSWCHETVAKDWQKFRSTENYNKLAYHTEFPWMADGTNGEISMNYGTKNRKGDWEVLRLYTFKSFENGIYRRDAVLETDTTVRYQLADISLPDGILRVDKVTVAKPTEIRLGHYSLPRLDQEICQTNREVNKQQIPVLGNGEYELAMIPLAGWEKVYTVYPEGLHPVSKQCALSMVSDRLTDSKIYVTLQLWKKEDGKKIGLAEKELTPVRSVHISADKKEVIVRLATGEVKTVLFE